MVINQYQIIIARFSQKTYEYHETKDSIDEGFIFGLFSLKNATWSEIKTALLDSQDQVISNIDGDCQSEIRGLKLKKNLGS